MCVQNVKSFQTLLLVQIIYANAKNIIKVKSDLEVHDVHKGEVVEREGLDHILFDVVNYL